MVILYIKLSCIWKRLWNSSEYIFLWIHTCLKIHDKYTEKSTNIVYNMHFVFISLKGQNITLSNISLPIRILIVVRIQIDTWQSKLYSNVYAIKLKGLVFESSYIMVVSFIGGENRIKPLIFRKSLTNFIT